jgi:hypothetical protein
MLQNSKCSRENSATYEVLLTQWGLNSYKTLNDRPLSEQTYNATTLFVAVGMKAYSGHGSKAP